VDRDKRIQQLLDLVGRLYAETGELSESDGDLQLWYNRGYANGMIQVLRELGAADQIAARVEADTADRLAGQEFLPWGKAYLHGFEMGDRETREVL
jgi:roadblock/LC7 domain-containing protein